MESKRRLLFLLEEESRQADWICWRQDWTWDSSLFNLVFLILSIWEFLTFELSMNLTSTLLSEDDDEEEEDELLNLYLFTPTIVSAPLSINACLFVELSSIFLFGFPLFFFFTHFFFLNKKIKKKETLRSLWSFLPLFLLLLWFLLLFRTL